MRALLAAAALLLPGVAQAHPAEPLRIWGNPAMLGLAERWAEAYRQLHPDVTFEFQMKGSDSAIHGLVSGAADLALMGRENDGVDDNGFARPKGYPVTRIEIANGSLSAAGKSDAVAVLVARDNPLSRLSQAQLGQILTCGVGAPPALRTWGQLGLRGARAARPIRVYAYDFSSRTGRWIQDRVAGRDRRMCWDRIAEFSDARRLDGTLEPAAERIGAAAQRDPDALVIANPALAGEGLRLVPLAATSTAEAVLPSEATVIDRSYPLARRAFAYVDRRPGQPLPPRLKAFVQFALSPAGQALVVQDRGYLPLAAPIAAAQAHILDDPQ